MITIHTSEFWISEPFELVLEKIRRETKIVKFGPLNVFNTNHQDFYTKWIGEVDARQKRFKLFRVTSKKNTSDMSVNGEYQMRINKPMIVVKYKVHFTALLGLFGILTFSYAVWYLLRVKGIDLGTLGLLAILFSVGIIYSVSTMRDLRKCEQEIERVIYKIVKPQNEPENEEGDDEEDENEDDEE